MFASVSLPRPRRLLRADVSEDVSDSNMTAPGGENGSREYTSGGEPPKNGDGSDFLVAFVTNSREGCGAAGQKSLPSPFLHSRLSAPPVTSRSNREQAHCVLLARRLAGKSGASPEGRTIQTAVGQLKVPGSTMTGAEDGDDIMPPPSPHEPHAGPHAGSCIGAPQAG